MARGRSSRGHFGRSRFGRSRLHTSGHARYSRGAYSVASNAFVLESTMDSVATVSGLPMFQNGTLFVSGGEQTVINQLDNFSSIQPQFYQEPNLNMGLASAMNNSLVPPGIDYNATVSNEPFLQESLPGNMVPMEQMAFDPMYANQGMGYPGPPGQLMPPQPMAMPTSFPKVDIMAVGNKTKSYNSTCYTFTFLLGGCCILPLLFMCCMWWKKIVYPKYELNV